jgi:hypothetical protein
MGLPSSDRLPRWKTAGVFDSRLFPSFYFLFVTGHEVETEPLFIALAKY